MQLTETSYVPILKWKAAEMQALKDLASKGNIMPLIEFVMPSFKGKKEDLKDNLEKVAKDLREKFAQQRIKQIPDEIEENWGTEPIFIDFSLLDTTDLRVESIKNITESCLKKGLQVVPTINLADPEIVIKEVSKLHGHHQQGICLRVSLIDMKDINELNKKIIDFLQNFNVSPKEIFLLIDLKEKGQDFSNYSSVYEVTQKITRLKEWRAVILGAGAFPKDLSECKNDADNYFDRWDWRNWSLKKANGKNERIPTFADYAIRHPIYSQQLLLYRGSASIKYTLEDKWLVMKGKRDKSEHYLAHAAVLTKTKLFYGETFSKGDRLIKEKADHYPAYMKNKKLGGTGNSTTWIYIGTNHHISCVQHQLSNFSESAASE